MTLCSLAASAGGLYIREFGHPAQGTSGAGGGVLAEDASTATTNPAGIFNLRGDSEWMVTGIAVVGKAEFQPEAGTTIPGNDGGDAAGFLPGAALFYTRKLSDDWGFTASLGSISGSALDYDFGFAGRYQGTEVELLTVTFNPNIAYRFNDQLSGSFGAAIGYGRLDFEAAIPRLIGPVSPATDGQIKVEDGDDLSATITASLMWQATDRLRFGLLYLGENTFDFDGDAQITLPGAGSGVTISNIATSIEFTFPQLLRLSTSFDLNDRMTLVGAVGWEDWSALGTIPVSTNATGAAVPTGWDDTWSLAGGFRYRAPGKWTYYGGISYDSSPVDTADRVAILPVDRQWRFSAGATYEIDSERSIGGVVTYLDAGDARIDSTSGPGRVVGDFDPYRVIFVGVNYQWR
jgi:long-chain fatty acid transport protein